MYKKLICSMLLLCFAIRVSKATVSSIPVFNPILLSSPIKNKLSVTGSFGELRTNHFHAGIDLRSNFGNGGDLILAAANGFVRKIKIDSKNYGNSIYVEHPNGFTTVYAHCSKFREDIEEKIKAEQYRTHKNELELEFQSTDFKVDAGDSIALIGNTGDSRGAHLHFELRLTGTTEVVDPNEYGLSIEDNISPEVRRLKLFGFDLEGNTVSEKIISSNKLASVLLVPGDIFGLAVETYDHTNNSWRRVGIKSLELLIDNGLFYSFSMDHWALEDARYINAHLDYKGLGKGRFQRCFKLQGNKIPIYKTVENDGFFYIGDGLEHQVKLIIADANGNETIKEFKIQNTTYTPRLIKKEYPFNLTYDKDWNYDFDFGSFYFPEGSFYDHLNCCVEKQNNIHTNGYCPWIGIIPSAEPIQKKISISLSPTKAIPNEIKEKCFVAMKRGNAYVSLEGEWKNEQLVAESKSLGLFSIMSDTIAPRIIPRSFKFNMSGLKKMSFGMNDNIANATPDRSGVTYNAYIDGQWIILKHDLKSHTITHEFEPWLSNGKHELLVSVEDSRHNQREYRYSFIR